MQLHVKFYPSATKVELYVKSVYMWIHLIIKSATQFIFKRAIYVP